MIKLVLSGLWVCAVTLLASYATLRWQMPSAPAAAEPGAPKSHHALQAVKTRMISVPVIADGLLQGYVMAQFLFNVDDKVMKRLAVKPELYLLDEAFKAMYAAETIDFRQLKKQDLPAMCQRIADGVNARLGVRLVEDVLIQELNYIPKERARGGSKS
jgi:hypothetical protein